MNRDNVEKADFEILKSHAFDRHMEILKETHSKTGDDIHDWSEIQTLWIYLYKAMTEVEDGNYLLSHVTFHRYNELLRNLRWHMTSVFSGAYDSAVRELRFILEDICQAVYLDSSYTHLSAEKRYSMIREGKRLRGRTLIEKLPISKRNKEYFKEIYGDLCDYAHPSINLLEQSRDDPKVVFFFREDWFKIAKSFNRKISDVVFFLIICVFPNAGKAFLQKDNIIQSLEAMDFALTLSTSFP